MPLIFADIEADNLPPNCTKIHCAVFKYAHKAEFVRVTNYDEIAAVFLNKDNVVVMHNGLSFDKRVIELLLGIEVVAEVVDTLFLSWYLYPENHVHGLAWWGDKLGHEKPVVDDWENGPIEVYLERCEADVVIQEKLWNLLWADMVDLYGDNSEAIWHVIDHINFKGTCAALQEDSKWKLDVKACKSLLEELTEKFDLATRDLAEAMPTIPIVKKKTRPKRMYKASGELTKLGDKWVKLVEENYDCVEPGWSETFDGTIEIVDGYKEPNPGSVSQVKSWLYSMGWSPKSFKFVRDKKDNSLRKIPQIKNPDTGMLCDSVADLAKDYPSLEHLKDKSIVKHRMGICELWLRSVDSEGFVVAEVQGFTNTLRFKHRICVNIPTSRVPYGKELRACLVAREGMILCGADMSSLEDRTKQHFMWEYDPQYVTEMSTTDFDPHLDMAVSAGLITLEDSIGYKNNTLSEADTARVSSDRHKAKTTNYSATYGAGAKTIARAGDFPLNIAEELHDTYWKRNWAIKRIAEDCTLTMSRDMMWLWNPVSRMWMYLKNDKDKFSTLNQSTGTYCFDRWLYHILRRRKQLTGQFHDEGIWELERQDKELLEGILNEAIVDVNEELGLNRELSCDVQFANNYSEVH